MTNPNNIINRAEKSPARLFFWLGLLVVALAATVAVTVSWRRWPDLIVDFGGQLYLPWRIANGAVLYRDLFYFAGGPLSQYFNALLFKFFGASFSTLIVANLTLVAAALFLIYRRFVAATDVLTSTLICLGIVLVFAFEQFASIGNYNYIAPYSHEVLHGLLLSMVVVTLLADWLRQEKIRCAFAAGFCSGLVFLTKPDICVALAVACVAALVTFYLTRRQIRFATKSAAVFLSAAMIPALGFFLFFLSVENWRDAARSVVFGWLPLLQTDVAKSPYYQWCLGLDLPLPHLQAMVVHLLFLAFALTFYAFAFRFAKKIKSPAAQYLLVAAVIAPLGFLASRFNWSNGGAALPALAFVACVLLRDNYRSLAAKHDAAFPLLWSVFGLVLLLKLGLFPRIWHYGFALAMPAFASAVYLLFWLLPRLLENRFQVPAKFLRATVGLVLVIGLASLFLQSKKIYDEKNLSVGHGGDRIRAFGPDGNSVETRTMNAALAWIDTNVPTNATIAALPEGILLNYLSRRVNPTPCLDWNPTMFTVFSQPAMTAAFEKNPPDYVFIVEWKSYEFGLGYFGQQSGYGVDVMRWIEKNYTTVELLGSEPLSKGLFGIKILKHIPAAP